MKLYGIITLSLFSVTAQKIKQNIRICLKQKPNTARITVTWIRSKVKGQKGGNFLTYQF